MKKIILFASLFGIAVMLCPPAMAKNQNGLLPTPGNVTANLDADSVCFSWNPVKGAVRYALEADVNVDLNGDGFTDRVLEFSFNTDERDDGREPSDPDLCVPFTDFVADLNGDGVLEQVFGPAVVKVKALKPGKGYGRPENDFSAAVDYTIPGSAPPPAPSTPPDPMDPMAPYPDPMALP